MKTQTVFRLGALAALLTAFGFTAGEFIYFFGAARTILFSWVFFSVGLLQVFAIMALYAAQVKRGDVFLLIGFVLLVTNFILAMMNQIPDLGVDAGLVSQAQVDKSVQVGIFVFLKAAEYWTWPLGFLLFGYGTFRGGVFPRWYGVILILLGVTILVRDLWIFEYLYAALALVAFGWFGLALWKNSNPVAD